MTTTDVLRHGPVANMETTCSVESNSLAVSAGLYPSLRDQTREAEMR